MWYRLRIFEGLLLIPFYLIWYVLKGIPFFTRCRWCGQQLFDAQNLRLGMCRKCQKKMAISNPEEIFQVEPETNRLFDPAEEHIFQRIVDNVGSGRILDIGCGCGRLLFRIQSHTKLSTLYGLDISNAAINGAKMLIRDANFCIGNAEKTPFLPNTFDYVICTEVLEHIEGDGAITECYRVLKPNGVALITVPNGKGVSGEYFPYHIRLFSFSSITDALTEAGFHIISGYKFGLYIPLVTCFAEAISVALGRNLPVSSKLNIKVPEVLATHFFIKCRKPGPEPDKRQTPKSAICSSYPERI